MPRQSKKPNRRDSKSSLKRKDSEVGELASEQDLKNAEREKKRKEQERARMLMPLRKRRNLERVEMLARPNSRRLRDLWNEKCAVLPRERRDKIKSALEEDYFLSPEQTEQYFLALKGPERTAYTGPTGLLAKRKDDNSKELRQRQAWLVNFSAQVAMCLCDYISKGQKEILISNRLRSIADVVLERVAEILGEPKPTRTNPGRLARFMVAISDRIAVWIENSVYRADAHDIVGSQYKELDEHIRLDAQKPLIC
ncbi:hypothetical protein PYW07_012183 [Mythimna separata]|uniref:Uncharacterized protein n=1 Tax=Mythimna separata TaxID=271217 RepID=A0AAD7YLR4_MYTSE|nr:hypothetical protein PYW07_012183 [Mythimna separata]